MATEELDLRPSYGAGHLMNPAAFSVAARAPIAQRCTAVVPSRVDTFLCRSDYFVRPPRPHVYPVCAVNFAVDIFASATAELIDGPEVVVEGERPGILRHAALLMKQLLKFDGGLRIVAENAGSVPHAGLGSSAALQAAVATAIHQLFGAPIPREELARFLAQNYGEESDADGQRIAPVPSIGGAATVALSTANLVIIGGECELWAEHVLPPGYGLVTALPALGQLPDGRQDRKMLQNGHALLERMGLEWGEARERTLRSVIVPAVRAGHLAPLFENINAYTMGGFGDIPGYFENRWKSHAWGVRALLDGVHRALFQELSSSDSCMFVSSGGPTLAVVTPQPARAAEILRQFPFASVDVRALHAEGARLRVT